MLYNRFSQTEPLLSQFQEISFKDSWFFQFLYFILPEQGFFPRKISNNHMSDATDTSFLYP